MRIGLLSDIHSDAVALQAALDLLHIKDVDQIICGGDVVEEGRGDTLACIQLLQNQAIPCVSGNHDTYTVQNHAWKLKNLDTSLPSVQAKLLPEAAITYLAELPANLRYEWEGRRILLNHGTFFGVTPQSPPRFFRRLIPELKADVIILGHTHIPMQVLYEFTWFLNPGAVTRSRGGGTCAILTLPSLRFQVWEIMSGSPLKVDIQVMVPPTG